MQNLEIAHTGSNVSDSITISSGIVTMIHPTDTTPTELLELVDTLLYKAKNAGRNRYEAGIHWPETSQKTTLDIIAWDPDLLSGNTVVDEYHRTLIKKANTLLTCFNGENDVENIRIHFSDLLKVFQEHCEAEEKILDELDYSRLDQHKKEHNRLIGKGSEALSRCEHTQAESTFSILQFVTYELVLMHLDTEDRDFFPLTRAQTAL